MKRLILIGSFLSSFFACSPEISEHFESNQYVRNYNIHVSNNDLQLYYESPADIVYTTKKKDLKKVIRRTNLKLDGKILAHGKTDEPPYEYFLTISNNGKSNNSKSPAALDTIIDGTTYKFIGDTRSQNAIRSLRNDLRSMAGSLEVGPSYRKDFGSVMNVVQKYFNSNKFYAALNEINQYPSYNNKEEGVKLQMLLTFSSFLGDNEFYNNYLDKIESRFKPNEEISKIIEEHSIKGTDALKSIVNEAKNHQVIMINENHYHPNHRLILLDLMEPLKNLGYKYLAMEALGIKQDSLLNLDGSHPTLKNGIYTNEQNFSKVIRKAKALGFKFVTYESTSYSENREVAQAENLYNKTFKKDPKSKVIVFAGIDHVLEKPNNNGKERMASVFKKNYNIDPLTISQTHLNLYRKQINSKYGLLKSNFFKTNRLTSVDYHLLNNKRPSPFENSLTFPYKNDYKEDVQVLLFYGNEIENNYDYLQKVPYYTTLLKAGKKYNLPLNKNEKVYLYTLDKNGKRLDKKVIDSSYYNTK